MTDREGSWSTSPLAAVLGLAAVLVPICPALYISAGAAVAIPPAAATTVALGTWGAALVRRARRSGGKRWPARPTPVAFQAYIATVVLLIAQHTEEWLGHLPRTLGHLFPAAFPPGVTFDDRTLIAAFPLAASALFLFGALAYYHRLAVGEGAAWVLFTWAIIGGAAHFVYPVVGGAGGQYVGGMITAPVVMTCGAFGFRQLLSRAAERAPTAGAHAGTPT